MGTRVRTVLILALAAIPVWISMAGAQYLDDVQDEVAWRRHTDPMVYLREGHGDHFFEAQVELEERQRAIGLVGRLDRLYVRGQTMHAAWSGDGQQLVTASGAVAHRWDTRTASELEALGPSTRSRAEDTKRWGFGFQEAVFVGPDRRIVGLTDSPPKVLWTFRGREVDRLVLDGMGYEKLTSQGNLVAVLKNLEYGLVVDVATRQMTQLPHPDSTGITFVANGDVLTLARGEVKRWRGAQLVATIPLEGADHPNGFSSDGEHFFVPVDGAVEVWSSASGQRRWRVPMPEGGGGAYCANGEILATGDKEGAVHLWSMADGSAIRSFQAHADAVNILSCSATQLLSVADERGDTRLWDLSGRPNTNPVLPTYIHVPGFFVRMGADFRLPGRMPSVVQFFYANQHDLEMAGLVGVVLWGLAAYFFGRRALRGR